MDESCLLKRKVEKLSLSSSNNLSKMWQTDYCIGLSDVVSNLKLSCYVEMSNEAGYSTLANEAGRYKILMASKGFSVVFVLHEVEKK